MIFMMIFVMIFFQLNWAPDDQPCSYYVEKLVLGLTSDVSQFGVFPDLVWGPGADGLAVDVDHRLLEMVLQDHY